jgi:hypothetical protein
LAQEQKYTNFLKIRSYRSATLFGFFAIPWRVKGRIKNPEIVAEFDGPVIYDGE